MSNKVYVVVATHTDFDGTDVGNSYRDEIVGVFREMSTAMHAGVEYEKEHTNDWPCAPNCEVVLQELK